jgi:predicted PurR-regulated permease PerM
VRRVRSGYAGPMPAPRGDSPNEARGPLLTRPLVRAGILAWSLVGIGVVLWATAQVGATISLVIVPLVIALFPAALLSPAAQGLKRRGLRPALAAAIVVVGFIVGLVGIVALLGTLIAGEMDQVFQSIREAYADIRGWADDALQVSIPDFDEAIDQVQDWATGEDGLRAGAGSAATTAVEALSSLLLGAVALFFYLKDGERIATYLLGLVPARHRADTAEVADRVWYTIGAYFRGQLIVAAVDAFFIGIGLVLLGVPLALPLAGLVFLGGLFPVVGAFVAGGAAVLIALADRGLGVALAVLAVNVIVQQAEGNLLEPLIVGRATKLHPLVVLTALTAGAVTFGILGAFLAVPLAASVVRAVGYFVERSGDLEPVDPGEPDDPGSSGNDSAE